MCTFMNTFRRTLNLRHEHKKVSKVNNIYHMVLSLTKLVLLLRFRNDIYTKDTIIQMITKI